MSSTQQVFSTVTRSPPTQRFRTLKHQVRMEIVAKTGKKSINVGTLLADLMIRANEKESVDFTDIHSNPFDISHFPDPNEFSERLAAETVTTGSNTKVTIGFFMISSANMQRIKLSIGYSWLGQKNIYLRIQRMDFKHGTDMYFMGYKTMDHPTFANPKDVEKSIRDTWYSALDRMAAEHDTNADDQEFLMNLAKLQEANLIVDDILQIPISVERNIVKVDCPGKKAFEVPVFQVYVPRRFRDAANYLNDCAILETHALKNLIPFTVAKNDPLAFYPRMVNHAKFLHDHRSITIKGISPTDFDTVKSIQPIPNLHHVATLKAALSSNRLINAIHDKLDNRSIIISTTDQNVKEVAQWLTTIIPMFPYRLVLADSTIPYNTPTGSVTTGKIGKYSKVFGPEGTDTDSTSDTTFDPSTIASTRTTRTNAWNNGPPINVTFDRRPSTRTVSVHQTPLQPRTYAASQGMIEPDQHTTRYDDSGDDSSEATPLTRPSAAPSDIADLVAKALATERNDLNTRIAALERQQQEFSAATKQWEQKMLDMRKQIVDATVTGTISVLTGASSPFATKEDAQQQRIENTSEFQSLKESMAVNQSALEILQQHMTLMLRRTEQLFADRHDPSLQSPPRKARATDTSTADSPMTDVTGVSNS